MVLKPFTSLPVTYHFLDETLENSYRQERMTQKLATWFSAFAIIITCLGLLGLASYTARQRQKEFGIRKVLGASEAVTARRALPAVAPADHAP